MRLAVALLPLCLAAEIAQYVNAVHHRDLRERALVARGEAVLGRQSTALQELHILLETISALPLGDPANGQICDDTFRRIVLQNSNISSLHLIGVEGKSLCSAPAPLSLQEEASAPPRWLDQSMESQQFSIWAQKNELPFAKDSDAAKARLIATLPIYDADRQAIGVLAATIPFGSLTLTMQEAALPDVSALALLDANYRILAQRTKDEQIDQWLPSTFVAGSGLDLMSGSFAQEGRDGVVRTYVVAALPGNIFGLYAQDAEELSPAVRALLYFVIAFPLLVWIAASFLAGRATEQIIIEPLNKVRQAIRRYIAGDNSARVEFDARATEEVQAVATKFNTMADTIHARDVALRAALDHQKALVREVNHRVRNNLQVMNSLLNLQSRRAKTPEQAAIFLDVQRRLNALGIVHSALYQGDD
ncbi:MAG: histidine kinase dimerization/phosphoacceptor domain -containing protein, partial [Hyphomicrobiales bacterium]